MNMSTCSLCPACIMLLRRAVLLFFFLRACLSAVKTQLFLFRFPLVAKRPFQMIPSVLMHYCKLTLKRRRILEPRSFLLNCCSGHRKTRKTAVFSCSVACCVIGNCWIRDEMQDTLGKKKHVNSRTSIHFELLHICNNTALSPCLAALTWCAFCSSRKRPTLCSDLCPVTRVPLLIFTFTPLNKQSPAC